MQRPGDSDAQLPGEPVGALIEASGEDLLMFSSDYPHPEGGTDPIAKFEAAMKESSQVAERKFYSGNFAALMDM